MEQTMSEDHQVVMVSTTTTARLIVRATKKKLYQMTLDFQERKKDGDLRHTVLLKSVLRFAREQKKRQQENEQTSLSCKRAKLSD